MEEPFFFNLIKIKKGVVSNPKREDNHKNIKFIDQIEGSPFSSGDGMRGSPLTKESRPYLGYLLTQGLESLSSHRIGVSQDAKRKDHG